MFKLANTYMSLVLTQISTCAVHVSHVGALSAPGWWRNKWLLIFQHTALALNKSKWFVHFFFLCCCCNVLGSQNAHPSTETYISWTLFVLRVIYNKPYCRCLSDLNWTTVLARAEPCVENRTVWFFSNKPFHPYFAILKKKKCSLTR